MIDGIARYFADGGPMMWPILAIIGGAVAVVGERLHFYFVVCRDRAALLVPAVVGALNADQPETALRLADRRSAPLNAILGAAIERYRDGGSMSEIRQAVDEAAIREVPRLTRRLGTLQTFANLATLAGLLGTIFGLQGAFRSLALTDAAQKAAVLAAGISEAMNTTSFGLLIAIPCLGLHALLASVQARRAEDLDAGALRLLNYLENRPETTGVVAGRISA
ncbi:MotA/TolQ/ExbB proton channel family protein [bacterium]|nr:MotA/TolQ/ExbB proton channel family protein [bacterium]